jgi:CBS-domain-containing membrane protein
LLTLSEVLALFGMRVKLGDALAGRQVIVAVVNPAGAAAVLCFTLAASLLLARLGSMPISSLIGNACRYGGRTTHNA